LPAADDPEESGPFIEEVRDKEKMVKHFGKLTSDARRHARQSKLVVGETVLMENRPVAGRQPRFSVVPFKIVEKNGGTVTIQNEDGQIFRRSTCQVKKMPLVQDQPEEPEQSAANSARDSIEIDSNNLANGSVQRNVDPSGTVNFKFRLRKSFFLFGFFF
jgi:hypothetical protein